MLIDVHFAVPRRLWQSALATDLSSRGHIVRWKAVAGPVQRQHNLNLLLRIERRAFQSRCPLFDPCPPPAPCHPDDTSADVVLVLAGAPPDTGAFLQPSYNGIAGEDALVAALLGGTAPVVAISGRIGGAVREVSAGRPAMNDRFVLSRALNNVLPRLVTLLVQAVDSLQTNAVASAVASTMSSAPPERSTLALLARGLHDRLQRRRKPWRRRPLWSVGYRLTDDIAVAHAKAWPRDEFLRIPDDGKRFYADPFAFEHEGRTHIFVEDLPYATRRGVITRIEIDGQGVALPPKTVLERPFHLSYPLLLRHDGSIYMLPETGATRRLQLFRADPFPDCWVEDRVLLDGIAVADATPIHHEGRWWMFAALLEGGGSPWDALGLFHAPDLLGPWTPHKGNPVLIDASATRPAGAMWHENGRLMRVAQDGRDGYGMGITICRIDRLDSDGFAQTVLARLGAPEGSGARATHTLNRHGRLEVIDLNRTYVG